MKFDKLVKQILKEGHETTIDVGLTRGSPFEPLTIEVVGQQYTVYGELTVDVEVGYEREEYQNIQGYGRVLTSPQRQIPEGEPNITINSLYIDIGDKDVYMRSYGQEKLNKLKDKPEVIKTAEEALINLVTDYYNEWPEKFEPKG